MTPKITDTEVKKLLAELAEHVPEIDPNDDEWLTFLKHFIAARPDIKIDKKFQEELRAELVTRAAQLDRPIVQERSHTGLWWKLGLTFTGGAAVCAAVVVPMLINTPTKVAAPRAAKMMARDTEMSEKSVRSFVEPKKNINKMTPPNEEIVPDIIPHTTPPNTTLPVPESVPRAMQDSSTPIFLDTADIPEKPTDNIVAPSSTTEQKFDSISTNSATDSPSIEQSPAGMSSLAPLAWADAPDDAELINIAQKFLEKNDVTVQDFTSPIVEKIWEINNEPRGPHAPEQLTVVFAATKNTSISSVRVTINLRTKTVENMIFSTGNEPR